MHFIELAGIVLFPIMLFPFFPDPVAHGKLYFLATFIIILLVGKAVKVIVTRKISWQRTSYDAILILMAVSIVASLIISAPNKIESLVDPVRGAAFPLLLIASYFLMEKQRRSQIALFAFIGLLVSGIIGVINYAQLFQTQEPFAFLTQRFFIPSGGFIGLATYAVTLAALIFPHIIRPQHKKENALSIFDVVVFFCALGFAFFGGYVVLKHQLGTILPYTIAWQTFIEGLKSPLGALFGAGSANFTHVFTQAKPLAYNTLPSLWAATPAFGSSAMLHIGTEYGLLGITVFLLSFVLLFREARKIDAHFAVIALFILFILTPLSQMLLWSFLLLLLITHTHGTMHTADVRKLPVVYIPTALLAIVAAISLGYVTYRSALAEYYFYRSLVATARNQAEPAYNELRRAMQTNPYREEYRIASSRLNLLIANSISSKKELSEEDRKTVSELIQEGIQQGRNAVVLNSRSAPYWANLGDVYRNILTIAQGADVFAIASYQQAIARDPLNPAYAFNLGSTYYALENYREAVRFFESAVQRKPDIPNYHYNLAWAYYRNNQVREAVSQLEAANQLVTDKKSDDYKKLQSDLRDFRAKLKESETEETAPETLRPETLRQPSPIPSITPRITLAPQEPPLTVTPSPTPSP